MGAKRNIFAIWPHKWGDPWTWRLVGGKEGGGSCGPLRNFAEVSLVGYVHCSCERHRQVGDKSEQSIVHGIVEEEVVGEFVARKVERVVYRSAKHVSDDHNHPPRRVTQHPCCCELNGHRKEHPVLAARVHTEELFDFGMFCQNLLSARAVRLLSVGPSEITDCLLAHVDWVEFSTRQE